MHGNKHLPVCSGPRIALLNDLLGQDPNNLSLIRFPKERYADMAMSPSKYDLSEKWSGILRQYCSLDMALERDKLPALSGIAKLMQDLRKGEVYLAGLWKDHLHRDLCWCFEDPMQRHQSEWRAPTWSWASVNGKKLKTPGPLHTFGYQQHEGSVVKERSEIFLLRILDSWTDMSCLVLRGVDTRNATYERIGFVKSTNKDWRRAKWLETTLTVI
jgi:hypothetical protein